MLKISKETIIILVVTLVIVLLWGGFEILHSRTSPDIPQATESETKELDPKLDSELIEQLQ
ncbi:MAG: hypothetical protein A2Y57_02680 [Candidatus Woykebacteria bacterium RBG_13_40_7b]|uniref:Uncharacterized protein n=1 Tax=Candidatus Woykebacteria bacterium RBG_13_40_7b TaxID=1802594 RepID=A0A1G1WCM0_9BACT|nr:MAG: hypothetical protein A2Y57_02680 [Candidatus Woykebacteria bacterium RBG_13_40_7b]